MSEECTHNCETCGADCPSKGQAPESLLAPANKHSNVKKVVGIVSGKGGVGKSLVTALMAVNMQRRGYKTAVLDADITGPSIPKAFGLHGLAEGNDDGIFPVVSKTGVKTMSLNLLLENETDPVVWRGPVIAGTVKQFWTDVCWGDVDFMFVDMPPGTGDVPLTVFQSLPLDGIIIVASPQELVGMIVSKAVRMAQMMNIPVLALVENMSYISCPDCGKVLNIFGESHAAETAAQFDIPRIARIPLDPALAKLCDEGDIESYQGAWLDELTQTITDLDKK